LLNNVILQEQACETQLIRKINNYTIAEFQLKLSYENWDEIFVENDVNISFNNFHNTYLTIFNSCFTKKNINSKQTYNPWMTKGIRLSYKKKTELYLKRRENNDIDRWLCYK
jgi:hypothetical protein